jgi:hypothetical protein
MKKAQDHHKKAEHHMKAAIKHGSKKHKSKK